MPPPPSPASFRYVPPTAPRRSFKPLVILAAVVVVAALVPITFKYQAAKIPPISQRAWRMNELQNYTEPQAIERFGQPIVRRDFQMTEGTFIGPRIGQKKFVPLDAPDYAARLKAPGAVVMQFPQFTVIRELIWQLPDSYLTIWMFQPRAEIDFQGDYADMRLPKSAPGVWVAVDNYRVGLDLVKGGKFKVQHASSKEGSKSEGSSKPPGP